MRSAVAALLVTVLALGMLGVGWAQEAGPPPETTGGRWQRATEQVQSLAGRFIEGSLEQYQQLSQLINAKYPDLCDELVKFLFQEQPDLLSGILPALGPLIQENYPEIGPIVSEVVGANDLLKLRVSELVTSQYPGFLGALAALPPGLERTQQAAALVGEQYPTLVTALIELLRTEFPQVLRQVQDRILERYPQILGDVARLLARTYPQLAAKVIGFLIQHYPRLLPEVIAILYGTPPPAAAPASPAPALVAPEAPAPAPDAGAPPAGAEAACP